MKSPNIELLNAGISQGVRRICLSLPTAALSGEEPVGQDFMSVV